MRASGLSGVKSVKPAACTCQLPPLARGDDFSACCSGAIRRVEMTRRRALPDVLSHARAPTPLSDRPDVLPPSPSCARARQRRLFTLSQLAGRANTYSRAQTAPCARAGTSAASSAALRAPARVLARPRLQSCLFASDLRPTHSPTRLRAHAAQSPLCVPLDLTPESRLPGSLPGRHALLAAVLSHCALTSPAGTLRGDGRAGGRVAGIDLTVIARACPAALALP